VVTHWSESKFANFRDSFARLIWSYHFPSFRELLMEIFELEFQTDNEAWPALLVKVLHHFPVSIPSKQPVYIIFVTFLLGHLDQYTIVPVAPLVFPMLARISASLHARAVEQSIKCWADVQVLPYLFDNAKTLFPVICPALKSASRTHWNQTVQRMGVETLRTLRDLDPVAYDATMAMDKRRHTEEPAHLPGAHPAQSHVARCWSIVARGAQMVDRHLPLQDILDMIQEEFPDDGRNGFGV
jgi:hypothetical protein